MSDARLTDEQVAEALELSDYMQEESATFKTIHRGFAQVSADLSALKDALVVAIGSPKDRDRMDAVIPIVLSAYRHRGEKAEADLSAARADAVHYQARAIAAENRNDDDNQTISSLQEKARAVLAARSCCDPDCCKASSEHMKALEEMRALLPEAGR